MKRQKIVSALPKKEKLESVESSEPQRKQQTNGLPDIGLSPEAEARRQAFVASLRAGWNFRLHASGTYYEASLDGEAWQKTSMKLV